MKNYIILSKEYENGIQHTCSNALGHEIHITRFILFDLFQKNIINSDYIIVTLYEDRFFLYDNIFKNVITWNDFKNNNHQDKDILDLTHYSAVWTRYEIIPKFIQLGYNFDLFDRTENFKNLINNLNFYDLNTNSLYSDIIKHKFILIHVRTNIINISKDNSSDLLKIINKIREKSSKKIVVFSVESLNINLPDVYFINNLKVYASFLKNENCKLFISEWSGGGQLSQYCYNGKIFYYFNNYPSNDYEIHYENYQSGANRNNNIFDAWDFKSTTDCIRIYYKTLDNMLDNM